MLKFKDYLLEANICPVCNSEPCSCPGGDNHITESDAAYAAGEAKRKEQEAKKSLTKKDASTVDKIRAMMAKEKMKEEEMDSDKKETPPFDGPYSKKKVATPGKQGYGMSAARHLARQAMQKVVDKQKNK